MSHIDVCCILNRDIDPGSKVNIGLKLKLSGRNREVRLVRLRFFSSLKKFVF